MAAGAVSPIDMGTPDIALGAIWYLAFLFSTTCHEAAHALAAKWGGDLTAFEGGQVTLNPVPHIMRSPFGMVIVPILSFLVGGWMIGWASAPYDPYWQRRHPHRSAWMALAGPAANFIIMLLAAGAIRAGVAMGAFVPPGTITGFSELTVSASGDPTFLSSVLSILFVLNLLLGTFNLLPVPPLDGHAGIMLFMPENLALRYLDFIQEGTFAMLGLLIAWTAFGRIFSVVFDIGLRLLYYG
jgi:Zn-dependent protease